MAATTIAKDLGLSVIATTRSRQKVERLRANGVDHVLIDDGQVASTVRAIAPAGVAYVLELVGTATLLDSLQAAAANGIVCMTGILGNAWAIDQFAPMDAIPSGVKLTTYKSETVTAARAAEAFQSVVRGVESGRYHANLDRVFALDDIQEAHRYMEGNRYCESFNSKLRDEFLNGEIFYSLKEAQILTERWRVHYNTVRPHSSLGYRPPAPMAYSLAMPPPSASRSPASTVM